jgi:hypothetical protein
MSSQQRTTPKPTCPETEQNLHALMPTRRPNLACETLDAEAVIYDVHTGAVHHLDETALWLWEACDGHRSPNELTTACAERFDVPLAIAATHVKQGLHHLRARHLLLNADEAGEPPPETCGPSRRELLNSGATRAILAAPVISTFFATGANASGPSYSAAFGPGGCKTVGYSCSTSNDCCGGGPETACEDFKCCYKADGGPCDSDADCCSGLICNARNNCDRP